MLKKFFRYEDRNFALAFSLLAGIILISVLFAGKRPGVVDWGNYENTMLQAGLTYTQDTLREPDELHYIKVIEEFAFEPFEPARFIQAKPTASLYYPVTVVRLFSEPFGIPFSTARLAVVYAVITIISLFYILKALYRMMGYRAAVLARFHADGERICGLVQFAGNGGMCLYRSADVDCCGTKLCEQGAGTLSFSVSGGICRLVFIKCKRGIYGGHAAVHPDPRGFTDDVSSAGKGV